MSTFGTDIGVTILLVSSFDKKKTTSKLLELIKNKSCIYVYAVYLFYFYTKATNIIHRLTSSGTYELRIDLTDKYNKKYYAKYQKFIVGSASSQYKLSVGSYSGNAGMQKYKTGLSNVC